MRKPMEIAAEERSMRSIVSLTSAFESLSSMKIMQTKGQVLISNQFFDEVWNIYKQIRVDVMFNFGRTSAEKIIDRELIILITASGGLSGDIDQRLIRKFRERYDPAKNDIIVIGHHGALQLDQLHIHYNQYFDLPQKDIINVDPLIREIKKYKSSRVFYQNYVSLSTQDIKEMDLADMVAIKGRQADQSGQSNKDIIDEKTYIFEPDPYTVTMHLETSMLRLTLTQFIYDSRLAQLASRFRAMSAAKERSVDEANTLHVQYSRSKRLMVDTRLKESLAGLKKLRQAANT